MIIHEDGDILTCGCDVICQQVNCQGKMGSGLAKIIRLKHPEVFTQYSNICGKYGSGCLGKVYYYRCNDGTYIANLFSQDRYGYDGNRYTDYQSFDACVKDVYDNCKKKNKNVAFPYFIGCALGGGDWDIVYGIIEKYFGDSSVECKIVRLKK